MSLKKQLARYKNHLSREGSGEKSKRTPRQISANDRYQQELELAAEHLNADIKMFDDQFILIRTEKFDLNEKHGLYSFNELEDILSDWQKSNIDHPLSSGGRKMDDLLFFDTETTGLGAGAGHMIFLIGTARVTGKKLILKQYFLPGPGHEAAFYHYFLSNCPDLKNLVTYNGKSFDWPRVKTRHQFVKERVPALPSFGHFDLLHASRRLWKDHLSSTRLETVEKEILKIKRSNDVPGHMAPFLYFQFLKQPKASLIEGVMKHNAEDIKTLVTLYIHLSKRILHFNDSGVRDYELYQVGRWYRYIGNNLQAISVFERLLNEKTLYAKKAMKDLASLYKKAGRYKESFALYETLAENDMDPHLCIEAAKLLEHQYKDIKKAIYYTELALNRLEYKNTILKTKQDEDKQDIIKRFDRLKAKERKID
ncbi:ribonuclease H-like domain-containing protein [Scopulibacillus cellulosilyticus]|uniref:Ribonuclease H-like domain-containing protein n=1 Tax=Scopulibacillus cellulosilyticus TaxID=2665665 RepID=A0ABW2PUB5_9BACL